ncbi:MAG TPA: glycoside hydrolase family 2 TIM barrel-domain containing protein [Pilimelia sp.]|nr:glycoside hydrolase family 2 TIM barrel-domain containing protein [Pilimelia sp.]
MGEGPGPTAAPRVVHLDVHGRASLDGEWEFYPADLPRWALADAVPTPITVPGLWEARGHLDLDGAAWYRLRFTLDDARGHWILRFAAVMDIAEVYLNGRLLGRHEHPFTPFELDATGVLRPQENVLEVRVTDPPVDDPEHLRSAHGKQGWANHVFPSRPSLYLTYGGIWQGVQLRRHGAVMSRDIFVEPDPDNLVVSAEVVNLSTAPATATVALRTLGLAHAETVDLPARAARVVRWSVGRTDAPRWSPDRPTLHELLTDVHVDGQLSDRQLTRYGLRTVRLDGPRMLVNDVPYRMKSVLVQGFRAEELYAEGPRAAIEAEVRAARAMGFNTLRLHIKAFDPTYLDVCDELGMLLHCDLPVAEPIAHDELGDGTLLSRRAVEAVTEQVRRDRNHPSIVLWSAMNELGLDREGARDTDAYEQFARTLYAAVTAADPTRPVIENDWVEPDPERVFSSPVLTAHWYGRLHADYLRELDAKARRWAGLDRPLFVTEFGDWGLPDMPELEQAPFWDFREVYAAGLAFSRWPSSVARFVRETQRYQGVSDRMQVEVFRRHGHLGGYCLTELTDVPHELNGLLDLHRRPKPIAVDEVTRANQERLPMLRLDTLCHLAGAVLRAPLAVANDGPALADVTVELRFGDTPAPGAPDRGGAPDGDDVPDRGGAPPVTVVHLAELAGYAVRPAGDVAIATPEVPGNHDLLLTLRAGDAVVAQNRYPIHVVAAPHAPYPVRVTGDGDATAAALADVGARVGGDGPLVVAEGSLDADTGAAAADRLAAGQTVLVLAQPAGAEAHYPLPVRFAALETLWGSSVFQFTTDSGALPSLPRRNLLVGEDSAVQAVNVVAGIAGAVFPDEPVVVAYKPLPGAVTGTVVGAHRVGPGRLVFCQYRLVGQVGQGDAAARALLADLVRWAADPPPALVADRGTKADGRAVTYYSYRAGADGAAR